MDLKFHSSVLSGFMWYPQNRAIFVAWPKDASFTWFFPQVLFKSAWDLLSPRQGMTNSFRLQLLVLQLDSYSVLTWFTRLKSREFMGIQNWSTENRRNRLGDAPNPPIKWWCSVASRLPNRLPLRSTIRKTHPPHRTTWVPKLHIGQTRKEKDSVLERVG